MTTPGPNGCTCGFNGDCNCPYIPSESDIDQLANDGRLGIITKRIAIEAGVDWTSLDPDEQDAWHERAIELLRIGALRGYIADASVLTVDDVKAALAVGAKERKAAERTLKRSPRR